MKEGSEQALIEGSGAEIARYAQDQPTQQFRLVAVEAEPSPKKRHGPGSETWEELIRLIESFRGQFGSMPEGAATTEGLYPD